MGTYTTNYNLYLPTVGEQGWGELMNGNLTTIDTTMAGLNTRLTAVEGEVNGNLSCTSVTTSGTITSTGKITANGGIGTKALTATSISNSGNMTNTGTLTCTGKIYANGGIEGVTTLNKVVTVSASTTKVSMLKSQKLVICPYVPGVSYTGYIKGYNAGARDYPWSLLLLSSGVWTTQSITDASETENHFTNAECVIFVTSASSNPSYIYLPIFS